MSKYHVCVKYIMNQIDGKFSGIEFLALIAFCYLECLDLPTL